MAYVRDLRFEEEEEEKLKESEGLPISTIYSLPGGSRAGAEDGESISVASTDQPKRFVDLVAYLSANRPQIEELAGRISEKLSEESKKTQEQIKQMEKEYGEEVEKSRIPANGQIIDVAFKRPISFTQMGAEEYRRSYPYDTSSVLWRLEPEERLEIIEKMRSGKYEGLMSPKERKEYYELLNKIAEKERRKGLIERGDIMEELMDIYSSTPTVGGIRLDRALLDISPTSKEIIKTGSEPFGALRDYLTSATENIEKMAKTAKEEAETRGEKIAQKAETSREEFIKEMENRIDESKKWIQKATEALKTGKADDSTWMKMKIEPRMYFAYKRMLEELQKYGVKTPEITSFLKYTGEIPQSIYDVMTIDDLNKLRSLEKISGKEFGINPPQKLPSDWTPIIARFDTEKAEQYKKILSQKDRELIDHYLRMGPAEKKKVEGLIEGAIERERDYYKQKLRETNQPPFFPRIY